MPKDRFIKSISGTRSVRLSKIQEFHINRTGQVDFPETFQLIAVVAKGDWMLLFKGTKEECNAHLEEVLKEETK